MNNPDENCSESMLIDEQIAHEEEIFEKIQSLIDKSDDSITIKHEIQKLMNDDDRDKIIIELIKLASQMKIHKNI